MDEQDLHHDLPGFDEPLALLRACHKNITDHCERLENLITHINTQGIDDEARQAARNIVRYFSSSALLHHRDEEEDLFPMLRLRCEPEDEIDQVLENLSAEHAAKERTAVQIRAGLAKSLVASPTVTQTPASP